MKKVNHHALPAFKMAVLLCAGILAGRHLPVSDRSLLLCVCAITLSILLLLLFLSKRLHLSRGTVSMLAALVCFVGGATKITTDRTRTVSLPDSLSHDAVVVARIQEGLVLVDPRTVLPADENLLLDGVERTFKRNR